MMIQTIQSDSLFILVKSQHSAPIFGVELEYSEIDQKQSNGFPAYFVAIYRQIFSKI